MNGKFSVKLFIFIFFSAFGIFGVESEVSDSSFKTPIRCLKCLCLVTTGCNPEATCDQYGGCGIFKITPLFWCDAWYQIYNDNLLQNYVQCAKEVLCSLQTVDRYMERYKKDCNGDNKIDCVDYLLIHQLGPNGCTKGLPQELIQNLLTCLGPQPNQS